MARIVALVRAKNGMRYFPRLIPQLQAVAEVVIILDDHSTDGSYEYLRKISLSGNNFIVMQLSDKTYNGGRDWNYLYEYAAQVDPDWIFCPDTDELIEDPAPENIKRLTEQSGKDVLGWSFPFYYLWNDEQHYRNAGMYHNTHVIRLFRYDPKLRPPNRPSHSTGVPDELDRRLIRVSDVRMWHYGYMLPEDRQAKYKFYTGRDADPIKAGAGSNNYNHMMDTPSDVTPVPSHDEWFFPPMYTRGDFLLRKPARVSIGSPFPTADTLSSTDELNNIRDGVLDDVRLFFTMEPLSPNESVKVLKNVYRVLRPGGRIEIMSVDYSEVCQHFIDKDDQEKFNIQVRFRETPIRQQVKTMYSDGMLFQALADAGFEDPQRIPLKLLNFRMLTMAYKGGGGKWV